jgi:hypothetical protein
MSSGNGDWQYMEYFPANTVRKKMLEEIEDYLEDSRELATWSHHYCGCDIVEVAAPPISVIQSSLESARSKIRHYQKATIRYKKLLTQLKQLKSKVKASEPKSKTKPRSRTKKTP